MSEIIQNKINQFPSYKIDLKSQRIQNLKSYKEVNINELLEISHILDSSYLNYKIDNNLNFILSGKK